MKAFSVSAHQNNRQMQRLSRQVCWLLLLGFLCQPLISYLAAPAFAEGKNGQQILICTLKGLQLVAVDTDNPEPAEPDSDCPALNLQLQASSSALLLPPKLDLIPQTPLQPSGSDVLPPTRQPRYTQYVGRAPPMA